MRDIFLALLVGMLLFCLAGCGGVLVKESTQGLSDKSLQLSRAVLEIEGGEVAKARELLEKLVDDARDEVGTDEALFRLALLKLDDVEQDDGKQVIALLDRLQGGYPASAWAFQAAPLHSFLQSLKKNGTRDRECRALRDKNSSLNREVNELRQAIERLKVLDRELEQKNRR